MVVILGGAVSYKRGIPVQACKNFHTLLRPGGVVNIGVRDYDYFIRQSQQIYARQVHLLAKNWP